MAEPGYVDYLEAKPTYPQYGRTGDPGYLRSAGAGRQFGVGLTPEENICVGIGPRNEINGEKGNLPAVELFEEAPLELESDGIKAVLAAAPGEDGPRIFAVWFPQHRVLCCGDNYYESWPNLYAIRGGQYRDISGWIDSLDKMREYRDRVSASGTYEGSNRRPAGGNNAEKLPGRAGICLTETLQGMNEGHAG